MAYKKNTTSHLEQPMFFGEPVEIQRYDVVKYPNFEKITEKQLSFFWRPEEVDVSRDIIDFKNMQDHEKHIFTSNLKRQIVLDTEQGSCPSLMLLPIVSLPELEAFVVAWTFSETVHSRSYTHIIRNIYPNPSEVFDEILNIEEIMDCAIDISKYYDDLGEYTNYCKVLGFGTHIVNGKTVVLDEYEYKKKLWLCINSINILEAIRFYVSFACSWSFAENKKMEASAKIIKLIARDESLHLAATQAMLRLMRKEDPDFQRIHEECHDEVQAMFIDAIRQEEDWADFLFKDGSVIGLNAEILKQYVRWIGSKRMGAVGVKCPYSTSKNNPLPWTESWINGSDVQVAPQEVEISSYVVGGIKNDITANTFNGLKL